MLTLVFAGYRSDVRSHHSMPPIRQSHVSSNGVIRVKHAHAEITPSSFNVHQYGNYTVCTNIDVILMLFLHSCHTLSN